MSEESGRGQVLVVDDEPNMLVALEDVLEDDFQVYKANSGAEALAIVEQEPHLSVVLSDQRMPGMPGDQLLSTVRDKCTAMRILLTGYADLEAVVNAVNRGNIFGYVSKPWDPENLRLTVNKAHEYHRIGEELKNERNFLESLMRQLPDAVVTIDEKGRIQSFNPAAEEQFGYSSFEVLGRNVKELMPEEMAREHDGYVNRHLGSGEARIIGKGAREAVGLRRDGTTFDMDLKVSEVPTADGRVFISIVRDITERKNGERMLQEAKERSERTLQILRDTIDSVPAGVALYNSEGALSMFNEYYRNIYPEQRDMIVHGMKFEDLVRKRIPLLVGDDEDQPALDDAVAARLERFRRPENFEEIQLPNDRWLHVHERRTASGTVAQISTDVTLLKNREAELRGLVRRNSHLAAAVGSASSGIVLTDASQESNPIIFVNDAFCEMTGADEDAWVGQHLEMLKGEETDEDCWRTVRESLVSAKETVETLRLHRTDGKSFWAEMRMTPVLDDDGGQPETMVTIINDVSLHRETEHQLQQAQKMEAVGQLTGGISHDFNNLLTIILGNLELLGRRVKEDPRLMELAQIAIEAAVRGADLTRQLLAFSRKQALEPKIVSVNDVVGGMDKLLVRTLTERVKVKTKLAADISNVFVDPGNLESALLNLSINARDAMPGGGELHIQTTNELLDGNYVEAHPYVEPGDYVLVSVTDSGTGMPKEVMEHIFEPFFTTKEVGKGTGLGLSMVYGFVKQSGGYINVYSEEGQGTTFRIYLPVVRSGQKAELAVDDESLELPGGDEVILLVEDNEKVRRTAASLLEDMGYQVIAAEDGPQALAILQERDDIRLIFTDVVMPNGMSGPDVAEEAKKLRPDVKILLTSGYPRDAIKEGNGFDILPKPYTNQNLARKVRQVLDE